MLSAAVDDQVLWHCTTMVPHAVDANQLSYLQVSTRQVHSARMRSRAKPAQPHQLTVSTLVSPLMKAAGGLMRLLGS